MDLYKYQNKKMITTNDVSELLSSESLEDKILGLIMLDSSDDWEESEVYLSSYDKQFKYPDDKSITDGAFPVVISKQYSYVIITGIILRAKPHVHNVFLRNANGSWNVMYDDESIKLIEE